MAKYHAADFAMTTLAAASAAYDARVAGVSRAGEAEALARDAASHWEAFHTRNRGRFFHPRYFVTAAFPSLAARAVANPTLRILELGAGNGSNAPLLEQLPQAQLYLCDVAESALDVCAALPLVQGAGERARLFLWDVVTGLMPLAGGARADALPSPWRAQPPPAELQGGMDFTLCMFVLSALHPHDHARSLAAAVATLQEGGSLLFRDHGAGDCAQLRVEQESVLAPRLHVRGDSTLSYFFTVEEVRELLTRAGCTVKLCEYHTVTIFNRKKQVAMKRVFVHCEAVRGGC